VNATPLVVGVGYVGRRFVARRGGTVLGLSRSSGFDLDTQVTLPFSLPRHYAVLYTVAPAPGHAADVRLGKLLDLLAPAPARFVYISTTGVYGDCGGELVDEHRAVNPESARAKLRVSAETALGGWCGARDVPLVILRVPGIYGPGRLGVERIREGAANIRESEAGPGNRIHVDDLVSCCEAALDSATPAGVYNVGDGDARSATWFAAEVARQCSLEEPPQIARADAKREFSAMRWSFLRESRRIDTRKMREVLGITPRYEDAADGIAASLRGA
jgi:nucleoside-diphosphate-sugar epimerase